MTSAINRGVNAAERTGRSARLKLQQTELARRRQELAAQLGASLYEVARKDETLRKGREALLDGIADIDRQRAEIDRQLADVETSAFAAREETQAKAQPPQTFVCPNCGANVSNSYAFCTGCGTPIEQIRSAAAASTPTPTPGRVCISCGSPLQANDIFCINCGTKQPDLYASEKEAW